jgi:hypothetical protein
MRERATFRNLRDIFFVMGALQFNLGTEAAKSRFFLHLEGGDAEEKAGRSDYGERG